MVVCFISLDFAIEKTVASTRIGMQLLFGILNLATEIPVSSLYIPLLKAMLTLASTQQFHVLLPNKFNLNTYLLPVHIHEATKSRGAQARVQCLLASTTKQKNTLNPIPWNWFHTWWESGSEESQYNHYWIYNQSYITLYIISMVKFNTNNFAVQKTIVYHISNHISGSNMFWCKSSN